MSTTSLMNLTLPTPSVTPGPTYASMLNQCFQQVDRHDHSAGSGARVRTAGLSIDAALSFGGFDATNLRSLRLTNQGAALSLPTDIGCLYEAAGCLFFNNSVGQQIQLTAGAALNAASVGGVGGDYSTSTASAFYTSASQTFTLWQAANKYANLSAGKFIIHEPGVTSPKGITLQSPAGLAADYAVTFPAALPGSTLPLSLSSAGVVSAGQIVTAQIGDAQVTTGNIADGAVTRAKLAAIGQQISASSGAFSTTSALPVDITNLSATITTTGRPVAIFLQPDGAQDASLYVSASGEGPSGLLRLLRDASTVAGTRLADGSGANSDTLLLPPGCVHFLDTPAAGTYTYKLQAAKLGTNSTVQVNYCKLVAYEL